MTSVIIPAHNEEAVIGRCLMRILDGQEPDDLRVIVVCNGCTDRTAEIAGAFGPRVTVLETPVPSKPAALNLGDAHATSFPRIFVDADIELPGGDLSRLADSLKGPAAPLAAAPRLEVELSGCSRAVAAYYRTWTRLPYVQDGMIGSGVYGLTALGRRRFERFPDIIADDHFVYRCFDASERRSVDGASFTVHPPATIRQLLHVHRRRRAGLLEHDRVVSTGPHSTTASRPIRALAVLARNPLWWPSIAVYVAVTAAGKASGSWKARFGDLRTWEREDSSRIPVTAAGGASDPSGRA